MSDRKVSIRVLNEDWKRDLKESAMNTVGKKWTDGKEIDKNLLKKYIRSEHSPIRTVKFFITLHDIPYPNSVHFSRHKIGVEHFVSTNRPDRTERQERSIDDTCNHIMEVNIQSMIEIMRKRLCVGCCDKETFLWASSIKEEFKRLKDELSVIADFLVPNCVYRDCCPEFKPCGYFKARHFKRGE